MEGGPESHAPPTPDGQAAHRPPPVLKKVGGRRWRFERDETPGRLAQSSKGGHADGCMSPSKVTNSAMGPGCVCVSNSGSHQTPNPTFQYLGVAT